MYYIKCNNGVIKILTMESLRKCCNIPEFHYPKKNFRNEIVKQNNEHDHRNDFNKSMTVRLNTVLGRCLNNKIKMAVKTTRPVAPSNGKRINVYFIKRFGGQLL